MSTQTQFGHTLFLDGFQTSSAAAKLNRLHFCKNGAEPMPFNESWLQHLIMRHPSLLPVDQIEPAFNALVPICTELPMRCGYLDNLLVTPAGDIALVECKLWRNPEARREVLAQIIDYAKEMSGWTYETLQNAVRRTKPLDGSEAHLKSGLYDLVSAKGEIDQSSFHDTVSRNLERGRFLLLIVGDGIREGMEGMAEFLQQHAGFHFTLAFVEIALFEVPGGYIAQPRVLARTTNIDRGIVTVIDGRVEIKPPITQLESSKNSPRKTTITQERYFEQLEKVSAGISQKLNALVEELASFEISADFGSDSMMLHWHPDSGRKWTLATISTKGQVFLDLLSYQANSAGLIDLHKQYLSSLANLVPGSLVRRGNTDNAWGLTHGGKSVNVKLLLANETTREGWVHAITTFQEAVMKRSNDA